MKIVLLHPAVTDVLGSAPAFRAAPPGLRRKEPGTDPIEVGYGLRVAGPDRDGKTNIVLAENGAVEWIANRGREKHFINSDLTKRINVCLATCYRPRRGMTLGGQWRLLETMKREPTFVVSPRHGRQGT